MFWRYRARDYAERSVALNRAELEARADEDPALGLVALDGDRALAWCSLGPRTAFDRLERSRTIPRFDERPVWAIVCFVVAAAARGTGLTRALIEAAVAYAAEHGAPAIEAYPADMTEGRIGDAAAYVGALSTFLATGFAIVSETGSSSGGRPRLVVRRELG